MKRILFNLFTARKSTTTKYFFALLLCSNAIFGQNLNQGVTLIHYVFNQFTPGMVKMKSGEITNQVLNYNILTGEMIFDNAGQYLAIATPENVDTVYISNRKFVPLNNKFFEVLVNSAVPLMLGFTYTVIDPGGSVGYGATSSTSAITSFNSLIKSGGAYSLQLPDGYKVNPVYTYWMMKHGKLQKVGNSSQLIKIFPDKKDVINDLVTKNNINFSKRGDIITLVKQIEQ